MIKQVIASLSISILVSLVFSFGVMLITGFAFGKFIGVFIASLMVQFFVGYLWNNLLILKKQTADDDIYKAFIEQNTKQQVMLPCAYCGINNVVDININEENYFDCKQCNQRNVVLLEFSTARAGQEINNTQIEKEVLNKIQNIGPNNTVEVKDNSKPIAEFR